MLFAFPHGELELRRDGGETRLAGTFPYNEVAVLSDGGQEGRPRKERIESRAFRYRVEKPDQDIHLLVGHSFDEPLASKLTGTLRLRDTAQALRFDATIAPEIAETSYGRDALALIKAGLAIGISPGFRIPPKRTVPDAVEIEEEKDEGRGSQNRGAIIRRIKDALLFELSLVTVPAYSKAQIEMRDWFVNVPVPEPHDAGLKRVLSRWRA